MSCPCSLGRMLLVVCTWLAGNAKKAVENLWPGMQPGSLFSGQFAEARQVLAGKTLDRVRQSLSIILLCPGGLVMKYEIVHCGAADADDGSAAGLTLQCDQTERFLNAGMNKHIGGSIKLGQLARLRAIRNP